MSAKKYAVVILVIFVVVLGPVFLLSNMGLGCVQYFVDKNPQGSAAPWFQYSMGRIFYSTLRPEKAYEAMTLYVDRYKETKDQRYWTARYYQALALEEVGTQREAGVIYRDFVEKCPPDNPHKPEAEKAVLRLRIWLQDY